jgi:hypothetical protein
MYHGRVHPTLFKYIPIDDDPGNAASALRSLPAVFMKFALAIRFFKSPTN